MHARLEHELVQLGHLKGFALPVIDELAALPAKARWGEWLSRLAALAPRILARPERVLRVLPELQPMAEAVLYYCFLRDLKVIIIGLWPQGPQQADLALGQLDAFGRQGRGPGREGDLY